MGRTVNLHFLISQRINTMLLRSLDVAISRFEALGFTAVVVSAAVFVVLPIKTCCQASCYDMLEQQVCTLVVNILVSGSQCDMSMRTYFLFFGNFCINLLQTALQFFYVTTFL